LHVLLVGFSFSLPFFHVFHSFLRWFHFHSDITT
jgi:hypothetical protein